VIDTQISANAIIWLEWHLSELQASLRDDATGMSIDVDLARLCEIHRQMLANYRTQIETGSGDDSDTVHQAARQLREIADALEIAAARHLAAGT
jgi:hypothetical protein